MSKKIISAILAIAMIVSMSATMFVTSVGAAAEETDYNTDRDALKSAIINLTIQGPTMESETIQYLKDIGLFTSKDGEWVEDKARASFWGDFVTGDNKCAVPATFFFQTDANGVVGTNFLNNEDLNKIAVTGKFAWRKTVAADETAVDVITENLDFIITYAASVWYFDQDANNAIVDASFNEKRNEAVKEAKAMIDTVVKALKAEVTATAKPDSYATYFNTYVNFATVTGGYNEALGINPYYGIITDYTFDSFAGSQIGQFAARWFTWDEVKANAQTELTAFAVQLNKLVVNKNSFSGKLFYDFQNDVRKPFYDSYEALCKALRTNEKDLFTDIDYTVLVKSYLKLANVIEVFDAYVVDLFNNRYTAANAELLTNVLYAKQILAYVNGDEANKLIIMSLVDVATLTDKILAGIAAFKPTDTLSLTSENIADATALVKSAEALLSAWNWSASDKDALKNAWNTLNNAKNVFAAMIPNAAGEEVLYKVAAEELKVADVKYSSDAFSMYFTPNYIAYIKYAADVKSAMEAFQKLLDSYKSSLSAVNNQNSDSKVLKDALRKYAFLSGLVYNGDNFDLDCSMRYAYNLFSFISMDELKAMGTAYTAAKTAFEAVEANKDKTFTVYALEFLDDLYDTYDGSADETAATSIYEKVIGETIRHYEDLDLDQSLDNVENFLEVYYDLYCFYVANTVEGLTEANAADILAHKNDYTDNFKFEWTKDSASFASKYEQAVKALESALKNLTRDITVEIGTSSYIVDELIRLFGLEKDVTEDELTEASYIRYDDITVNVVKNIFKALTYKIAQEFGKIEADELKVTYNVKAQLSYTDTMNTKSTKNYDGKTQKYVTLSKVNAAVTEIGKIIDASELANMKVTVDASVAFTSFVKNLVQEGNEYVGKALDTLLNYLSTATTKKEYKVSDLLKLFIHDYVDLIFTSNSTTFTNPYLYNGPVSAVYDLEASYKASFRIGDLKGIAVRANVAVEQKNNIDGHFYEDRDSIILCDGNKNEWAVKTPARASGAVLVKYTGLNPCLETQIKATDFEKMEVVGLTNTTTGTRYSDEFIYARDAYDAKATYYWLYNVTILDRHAPPTEEEEELYYAEIENDEIENGEIENFEPHTVNLYEGYVFNATYNYTTHKWYTGKATIVNLTEKAITKEAFDLFFAPQQFVYAILNSAYEDAQEVTHYNFRDLFDKAVDSALKTGSIYSQVKGLLSFDLLGQILKFVTPATNNLVSFSWTKDGNDVKFYHPYTVDIKTGTDDTAPMLRCVDVTDNYFANVVDAWLKLYDATFTEDKFITKAPDYTKIVAPFKFGEKEVAVDGDKGVKGVYLENVLAYLTKASTILANYDIAKGLTFDPAYGYLAAAFLKTTATKATVESYTKLTAILTELTELDFEDITKAKTTDADKVAAIREVIASVRTAIQRLAYKADGETIDSANIAKIYNVNNRLYTKQTVVTDQATMMYSEGSDEDRAEWQVASNYPADYFKSFVSAVNNFETIVNILSVNQKGESTHKDVNLTDLDKAYDAVIAAAKKLLTDKGESSLDKFVDKVVEIYKANVNGEGTLKKGEFNDYDYLYDKYMAFFKESDDNAMGIADGKGILSYFNVNKAEVYYYYALTLQAVLNNSDVANLYSFANDCYKVNLLNKLNTLCGALDVSKYSRAFADEYSEFRKVASYVRDILAGGTINEAKTAIKISSDMPLEYALKVLNETQAKWDEKDANSLEAIAAYKADLNALIAEAEAIQVYAFVTDSDDAMAIWTAFTTAFADAKKVSLDARTSLETIDATTEALAAAVEALAAIEAPEGAATVEALDAKIEAAYALIERADVTTDASKNDLKELLISTKKDLQFAGILNASDIAEKIEAIDKAMVKLMNAMFNNKNLKKAVNVLEMQVVISLYTEGSYKVFKDACDEAYAVAAANTAKESEMKAYLAKVEAKFEALVLAPVEEEPVKSEVLEQAIAIYNDAAAEYATLSGYTTESVAALKAALDTLKADIANEADDTKLLESIIAVKLARAALTVVVPETCD